MPRRNSHVPAYRLHKPSGQARVIINREHIYLGKYGSPESREKYARLIAELTSENGRLPDEVAASGLYPSVSINDLILAYWQFAKTYYVRDGEPTKELACMREALRPVRQLYGHTNAADFGPKALKAVRQHMIEGGACPRRGQPSHQQDQEGLQMGGRRGIGPAICVSWFADGGRPPLRADDGSRDRTGQTGAGRARSRGVAVRCPAGCGNGSTPTAAGRECHGCLYGSLADAVPRHPNACRTKKTTG